MKKEKCLEDKIQRLQNKILIKQREDKQISQKEKKEKKERESIQIVFVN